MLVAQKDQAKNYIFNPSVDKIDVFNNIISIPTDKKFDLTLFKETLDFEIKKVFQAGENRVGFGYVGNATEIKIENEMKINNNFSSIVSFDKETDTIYYWYKNLELDSLNFKIKNDTIQLVKKNGMAEYFDPITGIGLGGRDFSWTAAIYLIFTHKQI